MKYLLSIILFLCALTSQAATVRYALTNFNFTTATNLIKVTQVSQPKVDAPFAVIGNPIWVTTYYGLGTNLLAAGDYSTTIQGYPNLAPIYFRVPAGTSAYDWTALWITSTNVGSGLTAYPTTVADLRFYPRTSNPSNYLANALNLVPAGQVYAGDFTYPLTVLTGTNYWYDGNDTFSLVNSNDVSGPVVTQGYFTAATNRVLLLGPPADSVTGHVYPLTNRSYAIFDGTHEGDGSGLVNLNAANLAAGTLSNALPGYLQIPRALNASARALRIMATTAPAKIWILGDSETEGQSGNDSAPTAMIRLLKQQYGNAGTGLNNLDTSFNAAYFSRSEIPAGLGMLRAAAIYASDGASGVRSFQSAGNAATVPVNKVGLWWYGRPGGGNITVNLTNGTTNVSFTLNGNLASTSNIFYTNWSVVACTNNAFFVSSASATNIVVGFEYAATNVAGIEDFRWAQGGTAIDTMLSVQTNAAASLGNSIQADLILWESVHFPPNNFTWLNQILNFARGGSSSNAVAIVAHPPNITEISRPQGWNILHQVCDTNSFYYVDLFAQFPSLAANTAAGLMLEALHPNNAGALAWGAELVRLLGFNTPANINGMVTNGATGLTLGGTFTGNGAGLTNNSGVAYGVGTVTSVGLSLPGVIFNSTVTGSPVTTSGTLTPTLLVQTSNSFLAGPVSGSTATPAFRAMVAADVPGGILNSNHLDTATKAQLALAGTSPTSAPTNAPTFFNAINSGTFTAKVNGTNELAVAQGGVTIAGSVTAQLLISSGSTPTIVTNAGAGGGNGTVTVSSANSLSGSISLTTGSATPTANTAIFTLTFASSLANKPKVFLIPTSSTAGAALGTGKGWVNPSTTGFSFNANASPLTASTTYTWDYFVIQ